MTHGLNQLQNPQLSRIVCQSLKGFDDLSSEDISRTRIYPSKAKKGECRTRIGINAFGKAEPLVCFPHTPCPEIERMIK
jgi:hypothetical protein